MIARRLGLALAVAAVAVLFGLATGAERLVGDPPRLSFQVTIPASARGDADVIEQIWRQRLRGYQVWTQRGASTPEGTVVAVDVIGAEPGQAASVARMLDRPGAVGFYRVLADTPTARTWYQRLERGPRADPSTTVTAVADQWYARATASDRVDYYVAGPTEASIRAALDGLGPDGAIPPGHRLIFEQVVPEIDAPYWRSYLVAPAPDLDQADIAAAAIAFDANTYRPEVAITFTDDGARAFGELTAAIAGDKLAIVVDDAVVSAPIIEGAIRGGRAAISMSGNEPRRMEADARSLAAVLSARGDHRRRLPGGLTTRLVGRHARGDRGLLAVAAIALIAGVLAWSGAAWVARRTAPIAPPPIVRLPPRVGAALLALALTIALPALLIVLPPEVPLPGLGPDLLDLAAREGSGRFSVLALGVLPLVSGWWLAEVIALVVPGWRTARLGSPGERVGLDRLALVLVVVMACVQAFFMMRYLGSLEDRGFRGFAPGSLSRVAVFVSLVGGVMVHVVAAALITRRGVAHGVVVLVAAAALVGLWRHRPRGASDPRWMFAAVGVGIAVLAATLSRLRVDGSRLPWGGIAPVVAVLFALLVLTPSVVAFDFVAAWVARIASRPWWFDLVIALGVLGAVLHQRGVSPPAPVALSLGFVLVLVLAPHLLTPALRPLGDVASWAVLGVAAIEVVVGLRARLLLAAPAAVVVVHDVDRADRAADRLRAAGITHAVLGVHARAVLRLFGGYAPIVVQVAGVDRARAAAALTSP